MSKRFLGAVALGVGLAFVPVTVRSRDHATTPALAMSDACAQTGNCCFSVGDLCLAGDDPLPNYRTAGAHGCIIKPGT
jgi:hypothetical protein